MQAAVHCPDADEGSFVIEPDHRHIEVGGCVGQVGWPLLQQPGQQLAVRWAQIKDQQRDDDGEHTVAECLGLDRPPDGT